MTQAWDDTGRHASLPLPVMWCGLPAPVCVSASLTSSWEADRSCVCAKQLDWPQYEDQQSYSTSSFCFLWGLTDSEGVKRLPPKRNGKLLKNSPCRLEWLPKYFLQHGCSRGLQYTKGSRWLSGARNGLTDHRIYTAGPESIGFPLEQDRFVLIA